MGLRRSITNLEGFLCNLPFSKPLTLWITAQTHLAFCQWNKKSRGQKALRWKWILIYKSDIIRQALCREFISIKGKGFVYIINLLFLFTVCMREHNSVLGCLSVWIMCQKLQSNGMYSCFLVNFRRVAFQKYFTRSAGSYVSFEHLL